MRIVSAFLALLAAASANAAEVPQVGEPAPAFSLVGSDGRTHSLSDVVGKRELVLAWFPKAFTPG
jgi:peroxiredoxin Q/BCP